MQSFDSHLRYGWQTCTANNVETSHNKALHIINFKGPRTEATNLYIKRLKENETETYSHA